LGHSLEGIALLSGTWVYHCGVILASKLDLKRVLKAMDLRQKDFYDKLSDEEKKDFSPFLLGRYASSVQTENTDMQHLHIQGANDLVNNNFSLLSKNKKLFWLLLSMVGSGSVQFHPWVGDKKKGASNSKGAKFLSEQFPAMKEDEIALLAEINDKKSLTAYAKSIGMEDKEIKKILWINY